MITRQNCKGTWLPTRPAAIALGCSPEHLKRQRDVHGGFLEAGVHYALGSSATASITWEIEGCRAAFHRRGLQARRMVNEFKQIELILKDLKAIIDRENKRHQMDQHLTTSMRMLLEDEIIPQLENELDFDPTPEHLWDDSGGEPPVTLNEMHTAAYNQKCNS